MKSENPYFSIIVPVYNVKKELENCIGSLLNQTCGEYEIILVDDGSADGSGELCDQFEKQEESICAVHKINGGAASARNAGMEFAKGNYLIFVDADDFLERELLQILKNHLDANPSDLLKYGFQREGGGKKGRDVQIPYYEEKIYSRKEIREIILPGAIGPIRLFDYSKNPVLSACTCAYSRKFLETHKIRFLSEREILHEDFLFHVHALLYAKQVEVLHLPMYHYYTRIGSLSKHYQKDILQRKQKLLEHYKARLQEAALFSELESAYYNFYVDCMYACITNECRYQMGGRIQTQERIRKILNSPGCGEALEKCSHKGLAPKGTAIYFLMKKKAAKAIYHLYLTGAKG